MNNLKAKALEFLSRREYAYLELFTKLGKYTEDSDEIKNVLDELQNSGYLSEERYIKSYLNSKSRKSGLAKIKYSLKQKTGNAKLIEKIIKENPIDEYSSAKYLWEKKFGGMVATDQREIAKQIRFLQSRGYSFSIINRVIRGTSEDC